MTFHQPCAAKIPEVIQILHQEHAAI